MRRFMAIVVAILLGGHMAEAGKRIVVDLSKQEAYAYEDGRLVFSGWVSTGKPGHRTPTGHFRVLEKDIDHVSSKYPEPNGGAEMHYMLRVTDYGVAMHLGYVPNYPASHGCIRMENGFAQKMYHWAEVGTPILITGTPPRYVDRPISRYASTAHRGSTRRASEAEVKKETGPLSLLSTVSQVHSAATNRPKIHSAKKAHRTIRTQPANPSAARTAEVSTPLQLLSTVQAQKKPASVNSSRAQFSRHLGKRRYVQTGKREQMKISSRRLEAVNDPLHLLTTVPQKKRGVSVQPSEKRVMKRRRTGYEARARRKRRSRKRDFTEAQNKIGNTPLAMLREHK